MSALLLPALAAGSSGQGSTYVDDVFSTYLYTGNGSTQTINNGIDLAGNGGLVWVKNRGFGAKPILMTDTSNYLSSNLTNGNTAYSYLSSLNSNGFSLANTSSFREANYNNDTYASWTFRRAPKFFDVVTYTGSGTAGRQIAHNLGCEPGMIVVKRTDSTGGSWRVYHTGIGANKVIFLEATNAAVDDTGGGNWAGTAPTASVFSLGAGTNQSGGTYIAYLFAHDPSADGIIQCGSFTTDGSGNATVNLGWENGSQFAMIKAASATWDWEMYDTARTSAWSGSDARLRANLANAEDSVARISASSTNVTFAGLSANSTYIYMIVRSPS